MSIDKSIKLIKDTKKRFKNGDAWTQATYARDVTGISTTLDDPGACRWCLLGGLIKTSGVLDSDVAKAKERDGEPRSSIYFASLAFDRVLAQAAELIDEAIWNKYQRAFTDQGEMRDNIARFNDHDSRIWQDVEEILESALDIAGCCDA